MHLVVLSFLVTHFNKQMFRYPVFIDAVLQSSGIGLIGTHGSTMSVLAGRRVHDWYNGVYKDVQFFED